MVTESYLEQVSRLRGSSLLKHTDHCLWPVPSGPWVLAQTWHDLLFAHWPVPVDELRGLVPEGLHLDTYDGWAWVGVVPFRLSGLRVRGLPPFPYGSVFPELNVRTYVTAGEKPGVWFFSLDAGNPLAVVAARWSYFLPYFRARMSCDEAEGRIEYTSRRTHRGAPPGDFAGIYGPAGPIELSEPGSLAHFLTERYCLYSVGPSGRIYRANIHHLKWPLQSAEAELEVNTVARAAGITLPPVAPLLHFARVLHMVTWLPEPVPSEELVSDAADAST
ncbi:MAG: DUF2071 domain-containing protein [Chloroflexota bacterium]|nr:DUF2071 domain-containing protein [Chloroflexota bacterium]